MERKKLIENFWNVGVNGDRDVWEDELGWPQVLKDDAKSDYSETIFRYVVEIGGFNLLFYWLDDGRFYAIETEKTPIEVRRIFLNPKWDGKSIFSRFGTGRGPHSSSAGEVLATFDDPTMIWDNLSINDVPIGRVIERSVIIEWD